MRAGAWRFILVAVLSLAGIADVAADGQRIELKLTLSARSSDPSAVTLAPQPTSTPATRIDAVWLGIRDVRLRRIGACSRPAPHALADGSFTAELVSARLDGLPGALATDAGRYCSLALGFRRVDNDVTGMPDALRGATILIQGRRADGTPFVLRSRRVLAPRLRSLDRQGIALTDPLTALIISVDLARWFKEVDLSLAEPGEPGAPIRIDESNNRALLERFHQNLRPGFALFLDRDRDGALDADERAAPVAGTQAHDVLASVATAIFLGPAATFSGTTTVSTPSSSELRTCPASMSPGSVKLRPSTPYDRSRT